MNCGLFHSNIHSHSPPLWTRFSGVGGGGGLRKSFPGGLTGTFDLWNISEGCKKNWLFLWGGGRGPLLYFATTVLQLRKKNRSKINSETGLKIMTPRDIQ